MSKPITPEQYDNLMYEGKRLAREMFTHVPGDATPSSILVAGIVLYIVLCRTYNIEQDQAMSLIRTCPLWDTELPETITH